MPVELDTYAVAGDGFIGCCFEAPIHITIDPSYVQSDASGNKIVPALTWWMGPRDAARPLPRTRLTAGTNATGSFAVTNAAFFQKGETLVAGAPWAHINFFPTDGDWKAGDTIAIIIDGYKYIYTVESDSNDNGVISNLIAEDINVHPYLSKLVRALVFDISAGFDVFIASLEIATNYSIEVNVVSAAMNGQIQDNETRLTPYKELGTIADIDVETNTITLTSAPLSGFPPGYPIGVPTNESILGFNRVEIDLSDLESLHQGLYNGATGVQRETFPYLDNDIEQQFPKVSFV